MSIQGSINQLLTLGGGALALANKQALSQQEGALYTAKSTAEFEVKNAENPDELDRAAQLENIERASKQFTAQPMLARERIMNQQGLENYFDQAKSDPERALRRAQSAINSKVQVNQQTQGRKEQIKEAKK